MPHSFEGRQLLAERFFRKLLKGTPVGVNTTAPTVPATDTDPGMVMGSVHYMSPEQARGLSVDVRTGIFSLGVVLYEMTASQLDLDVFPDHTWNPRRGPSINFERYLRREVLEKIEAPLVWGLDEVDRLFTCSFGGEVFGLFRSWHNERALDPSGPWQRLTLQQDFM